MGLLNILGYIGVGLVSTAILMGISYAMSRPKETILLGEGENMNVIKQRGEGSWTVANFFSAIIMCVIAVLLLFNLAHFSVFKSIGLGALGGIILELVIWIVVAIFLLTGKNKHTVEEGVVKSGLPINFINCLLSGTGFAILVAVWGWF